MNGSPPDGPQSPPPPENSPSSEEPRAAAAATAPPARPGGPPDIGVRPTRQSLNRAQKTRFDEQVLSSRHDGAMLDAIDSPDYVDYGGYPGQPPGREGFKGVWAAFVKGYPDMEITEEFSVAEGDMLVATGFFRGTNTGPFMGMKPTNERVVVRRSQAIRFDDEGQAQEAWGAGTDLRKLQVVGSLARLEPAQRTGTDEPEQRFVEEFFVNRNAAALAELVDEGAKANTMGMLSLFSQATSMPDVTYNVEDRQAAGPALSSFVLSARGTHTGPGLPQSPEGRSVTINHTIAVLKAEGRVWQIWHDFDEDALARQLGQDGGTGGGTSPDGP